MSDVPEPWALVLTTGWRVALVLTGCPAGASKVLKEAVDDVLRHPEENEIERMKAFFYSVLRRRALRFPARCELTDFLADLHRLPEPARSTVTLLLARALSPDDLLRVMEISKRAMDDLSAKNAAFLSGPSAEDFDGLIEAAVNGLTFDRAALDEEISRGAAELEAEDSSHRRSMKNPAVLAVGIGFLLLVAVLTWQFFLGGAGVFPDDAIKIATVGDAASLDQFEVVDSPVGSLPDWFMMKSFDGFRPPPGLAKYHAAGVRLFQYEDEPIAQVVVPENTMFFYCFAAQPLGLDVTPEGTWRITEVNHFAIAIREDKGTCFMIVFHGTKAQMQQLLLKAQDDA